MVQDADVSKPLIHRVYDLVLPYFRRRRMARFDAEVMERIAVSRIVDLGGSENVWRYSEYSPEVTVLNLDGGQTSSLANVHVEVGDATAAPFDDQSFDLAFSNSVIEHVGRDRWPAFASECRRLAPSSFVQTPARWFPIEPHLLAPFVHFLPIRVQSKLLRNFTGWGLLTRPSQAEVDEFLAMTTLLTRADMERLFPDHDIVVERFLGMPKSYVAVRLDAEAVR